MLDAGGGAVKNGGEKKSRFILVQKGAKLTVFYGKLLKSLVE